MSEHKIKVQVLEGEDNKLDLAKLQDILRRKLVIPSYQRPYAWESEDIEEIFRTISSTQEDNENICFFGSIILSKKSNGFGQEEYYIIDGQQRLSSFLLLLRVFLATLSKLLVDIKEIPESDKSKKLVKTEIVLEDKKRSLEDIIKIVSLKRETSNPSSTESHILSFIKKGGKPNDTLKEMIDSIYECCNESFSFDPNEIPDSSDTQQFNNYIDKILDFLELILNKIKLCLICITGENSESFAVNLFNTLNTTGQPLTAFEVLKSELYTLNQELSKKIEDLEEEIIKKYTSKRKIIISHTGKLLLYLPLYRGDFGENGYTLSDNKFKDQRGYLKEVLTEQSAPQLVKDIKNINDFYSKNWLNVDSPPSLLKNNDEQVCFRFLSELKHDRVLPIIIRFYYNNKKSLGECVKICTAFSSLWRAYCDGGTSGVDKAYKDISKETKGDFKIENVNNRLKEKFLKKLSLENIRRAKEEWVQKMKTSTIYKNQKLSKFLLFLAYNQRYFDSNTKSLKTGKGIDILDIPHWKHFDYKTIEHITPKFDRSLIGHTHTIGNLTLLPRALNSSLGNKPFSEKLKQYRKFCSNENDDKYPYLPIIKQIASYGQFTKKEIEERSTILSEFIWQTLAEGWLGWKS